MTNKQLIKKLENACVVCRDCGLKYGVYSVGCSSVWEGVCNVCGETKPITETRDYGYLMTGIRKLIKQDAERPEPKAGDTWLRDDYPEGLYIYDGTEWVGARKEKIKQQSKEVANYMLTQEPLMTDEDLDRAMNPSYMNGDITLNLTEDEVGFLHQCLDTLQESHYTLQTPDLVPDDVKLFEEVEKKITELYEDHCVKYELSQAMKKYHELYGTFGFDSELDTARWEGFRAGFREGEEG